MEQLAPDVRRQLITRVANELVREVVAKGQTATLKVVGHSMWPLLRSGDVVVVQQVKPEELQPGLLVVCMQADGSFLAHRLLAVLPDGRLLTRGDARLKIDPPWPSHALVGQVVAAERAGQPVRLNKDWPSWVGRVWAWAFAAYRAMCRVLKKALLGHAFLLITGFLYLCLMPPTQAAATLLYFTAEPEPGAILLRWETATELNSSAFRIYRALNANGPWDTWIHQQPAVGDIIGAIYQHRDFDIIPGMTYYYLLEEIEADDTRIRYIDKIASAAVDQPITATPTPTATWTHTPAVTPTPTPTSTATLSPKPHVYPTATRRYTNTPSLLEGGQPSPTLAIASEPVRPSPTSLPPARVATPTSSAQLQEARPVATTPAPVLGSPASPTPDLASVAVTVPPPISVERFTSERTRQTAQLSPLVTPALATREETTILGPTHTPVPVIPARPDRAPRLILWFGSAALGLAVLLAVAALRLGRRAGNEL